MRVELVIQPPVFSQSGILSYFPYSAANRSPQLDGLSLARSTSGDIGFVALDTQKWLNRDDNVHGATQWDGTN